MNKGSPWAKLAPNASHDPLNFGPLGSEQAYQPVVGRQGAKCSDVPDDQYAIAEREPVYHVGQLNGDRQ